MVHGPRRNPTLTEWTSRAATLAALVLACSSASAPGPSAPSADAVPLTLPADIVYEHTVGPDSAVVFRHGVHVSLEGNRCTSCHPKLFRILKPTGRTTHREMDAGRSCGACHDGRHAFAVRSLGACKSCHVGRQATALAAGDSVPGRSGRADSFRGPAPIVYRQSQVSPGEVTFRHATHMRGAAECATCHPRPFAMKARGSDPAIALHDARACGSCHDGKKAFSVEEAKACERCHVEKGGGR